MTMAVQERDDFPGAKRVMALESLDFCARLAARERAKSTVNIRSVV